MIFKGLPNCERVVCEAKGVTAAHHIVLSVRSLASFSFASSFSFSVSHPFDLVRRSPEADMTGSPHHWYTAAPDLLLPPVMAAAATPQQPPTPPLPRLHCQGAHFHAIKRLAEGFRLAFGGRRILGVGVIPEIHSRCCVAKVPPPSSRGHVHAELARSCCQSSLLNS
jgi:hypothetical protein